MREKLKKIQKLMDAVEVAQKAASAAVAELLPPGTPVEFRNGNMACIHNAVVEGGLYFPASFIRITNTDTGNTRTLPVSALVPPPTGPPRPPLALDLKCDQCGRDVEAGASLYPCACKANLCLNCYGSCKECGQ